MNFFDLSFNAAALVLAVCTGTTNLPTPLPEVALIIDDIGYDYASGRAAIDFGLPFAISVLPFSPHAKDLAAYAHSNGKDVMIHVPMEAHSHNHFLGPGALLSSMSRHEFDIALGKSLDAIPQAIGVNNHMGSKLTGEADAMAWLMAQIRARGTLFFIDSRTSSSSVALGAARNANLQAAARDVFIDNIQSLEAIEGQLSALVKHAKEKGRGLAIGHPHRVTLAALKRWDPQAAGVRVVSVRRYMRNLNTPLLTTAECGKHRDDTYAAQDPNAEG